MNSEDFILDISTLNIGEDFDTQVINVLYHVRLTANEVQSLTQLFNDLENTLQCLAPGLRVKPFGSIVTGLGIKSSDVDCYIQLPNGVKPSNNYVIYARNILRRKFRLFTNLFAITTAKVPIVKFLHIPTNCRCDVNFKSPAGVQNSHLVANLLHMDPTERSLKLAILVKYWSKVHKITGTNLLASYALTIMVIFYLQVVKILPPIFVMQKNIPPFLVDNWNMGFNGHMVSNLHNFDSLYNLLGGFFKYYSNINFEENVISPFMGCLLNKKLFRNLDDIPDHFELYKQNIFGDICKPLKTDTPICIQDPFEHSRNCSAAVFPKLATRIKNHFQFAATRFNELPSELFLKAILVPDPISTTRNVQMKPKHVFQNKVMKVKHLQHKRNAHQLKNIAQYKQSILQHRQDVSQPVHDIQQTNALSQSTFSPPQNVADTLEHPSNSSSQHLVFPSKHTDPSEEKDDPPKPLFIDLTGEETDEYSQPNPIQETFNPPQQISNPSLQTSYSRQQQSFPVWQIPLPPQPTPNPFRLPSIPYPQSSSTTEQSSNVAQPTLNPFQQTSNLTPQTSNTAQQTSNTSQETSNLSQQVSNQTQQISNTPQETSNTIQQTSNPNEEISNPLQETSNSTQQTSDTPQQTEQSSDTSQLPSLLQPTFIPRKRKRPFPTPKKRGLQVNATLIRCYEQIKGIRKKYKRKARSNLKPRR